MESQPGCLKQHSLTLLDAETNSEYALLLNEEDYKRAQIDVAFASTLLNFAKNEELRTDEYLNKENRQELESPKSESWDYNAVICLLSCMENNMEDMQHPKKKKNVFPNISNELLSNGFIYNATACYNKWRSLLRSYKSTKDKNNKTGRGASRFMFFEQMDNLLGDKPSISAQHTMESSEANCNLITDINTSDNMSLIENHTDVEPDLEVSSENEKSANSRTKFFRKRKRDVEIKEENKEKRHKDRINIEREKLTVEKQKVKILQEILLKLNENNKN
ncbi:trihelix transcription factor DF1-like [Coccinella septempunctata]|uniref:trihelix transcription factor DF1-like n=1 Tax=Coccinella septempunctata TaxID=41139 RepID=UPI001D069320|nr:trihelix transcription factor DF1-like [Coccinella septempunctata]